MNIENLIVKREQEMMLNDFNYNICKKMKKYWKQFLDYSKEHNIEIFDKNIKDKFLKEKYSCDITDTIIGEQKTVIKALWILEDLDDYISNNIKKELTLNKFQKLYSDYIVECEKNYNSNSTIRKKKVNGLEIFNYFESNLNEITDINNKFLNNYVKYLQSICKTNTILKCKFWVLRDILNYLYDNRFLSNNYFYIIPDVKKIKYKQLPNILNKDDVEEFLKEAKKYSKRNYAIFLLGIRYGIRLVDIIELKLMDIDWANNIIGFIQRKTNTKIELPLTNEAGNAILDYILNERKHNVESKYIFLSETGPYTKLADSCLYGELNKIIENSNMSDKTKRGFHSFRHTFATAMVRNETSFDIISSTLGHLNENSSKVYINLNNDIINQCSLEENIYEQR